MSTKTRQGLFNVIDSFIIRLRNEVYLIGSVEEGNLEEGWFVNVPLNRSLAVAARISQVEDIEMTNFGGIYKLLIINMKESEDIGNFFALNVGSESLEITIDREV